MLSGTTAASSTLDTPSDFDPTTPVDATTTIICDNGQKDLVLKLAEISISRTERRVSSAHAAVERRASPIPRIMRAVDGPARAAEPMTTLNVHQDEDVPTRPAYIVAHDLEKQKLFDKYSTPKAIQFELARGIMNGLWTWQSITESLIANISKMDRFHLMMHHAHAFLMKRDIGPQSQSEISLWCVAQ